jgi:hypothetical protein
MAEPEPRSITYREVEKAYGGDEPAARSAWQKVCDIVGTGNVQPSDTATIALTGLAEGKVKRVEGVLAKAEDTPEEPEKTPAVEKKSGGNK